MYKLDESIFSILEKIKPHGNTGEYEITDALNEIMPFHLFECDKWMHLSYPWDILDANRMILEEHGSLFGKCEIRPGAYIEEPVAIGDGAVIGPNCYIRGFSSIGAGCKIGNAVEIKNSIIMDNTFVSHLSYVGDSIAGRNCNIAAGTIFANLRLDGKSIGMKLDGKYIDSGRRKLGGIVGDNVQFGVNCTIMPGKKVWPNLKIPPCTIVKDEITKQPNLKSWKRVLTV